jgi:hypothetical protein
MLLNAIVFSKDRPMQLHLLLESILTNFNVEDYKLNILYKASNDEYDRGYNTVRDLFPQFTYKKEESFKEDLLSLFNESQYTVFFTDDDIIYNSLRITNDDLFNIFQFSNCFCFSLRLGLNTTECYTMQKFNTIKKHNTHSFYHDINLIEPIISWKVGDATNDYAYPMSVDGHIFKTDVIKSFCEFMDYYNPNIFEAFLSKAVTGDMVIASYEHSKLVNTPINRVQDTFQNLSGLKYGYTSEDLNEMYLDGIRIDLKKMNFEKIIGCHQEIRPVFKINEK